MAQNLIAANSPRSSTITSEQLREHMYWEETDLFSVVDELQLYGDWSEVVLKNNEISDPLFGSRVERKYGRLLARIQQRVVWDKQEYLV